MEIQLVPHVMALHTSSDSSLLILKVMDQNRFLGIPITTAQATGIAASTVPLQGQPLSHDLLCIVLEKLRGEMEKVFIRDVQGPTFYASLIVAKDGQRLAIDCRPSDGIAMAVRLDKNIFVAQKVLEERGTDIDIVGGHIEEDRITDDQLAPFKDAIKGLNF